MNALLTKTRLNTIRRALYGANMQAVFYKVTPSAGPTEIGRLTSGFLTVRERRAGQEIDGSGVRLWMAADAGIDRSLLHVGASVDLIIDGRVMKYRLSELLPMQQLGSGYTMRLTPITGATA